MNKILNIFFVGVMITGLLFMNGCSSVPKKNGPSDAELQIMRLAKEKAAMENEKDREIADLSNQIDQLKNKTQEVSQELSSLESAKKELESKLSSEISEYKAKLEMTKRGLVITFLDEILFDPGKDIIKESGQKNMMDVAQVLKENVLTSDVAIEGHTDSQPIKYSGWKSNWELSSARALSVLHFLIDKGKVDPERLSAVGYGEYHPVASNDTPEGQAKNRRVEIVVLPENLEKVR